MTTAEPLTQTSNESAAAPTDPNGPTGRLATWLAGELVPHDLGCECPFPGKCARIAGDVIGGPSVAVLDRNLHMVEPSLSQCVWRNR